MSLDRLAWQREHRRKNKNADTKKYEKTVNGYLMRKYRNMKNRINGSPKSKAHLYIGKSLMTKEEFYVWAKGSVDFFKLWNDYVSSGYERKLAPTVDRIDSSKGYEHGNIEWITHSENSSRGSKKRWETSANTCYS